MNSSISKAPFLITLLNKQITKVKIEEQIQREKRLVAQKETNVAMNKSKYSLQTQVIVSIEAPSWKGIERRTGGPGWGAFGPGKDQEIVVSLNTNATPCSSNNSQG